MAFGWGIRLHLNHEDFLCFYHCERGGVQAAIGPSWWEEKAAAQGAASLAHCLFSFTCKLFPASEDCHGHLTGVCI